MLLTRRTENLSTGLHLWVSVHEQHTELELELELYGNQFT